VAQLREFYLPAVPSWRAGTRSVSWAVDNEKSASHHRIIKRWPESPSASTAIRLVCTAEEDGVVGQIVGLGDP